VCKSVVSEAERARAISRQKFLWDLEHNMNASKEEGRAEGKTEGKVETASRMFELGLSLDIISKSTDLSIEELERLRSKQ
jgi:predicted transposase/invertase (TIGR01784 family)